MTTRHASRRALRAGAVLVLALLAACVAPATHSISAAPTPCADSSYLRLRQQAPDSLSAREWERLQTLDRQCAAVGAPSHTAPEANGHGMMGMGHGGGHWMAAGIGTIMMLAMIIAMW